MMNTFLLGISGKARSGKDTLAREIHALLPRESWIYGFADDLKGCARVLGWMQGKNSALLQVFGTEVLYTHVDPNRLIMCLEQRIIEDAPQIGVIRDCRRINEFDWVKRQGVRMIRVNRLSANGEPYIDPSRSNPHPT